ncbi:MAG: CBS domain-containing protein, partial [Chloroflexota bacterium]
DLLVHDQTDRNLAYLLTQMDYPDFPVPFGVIYAADKPTYEEQLIAQIQTAQEKQPVKDLRALYHNDYTWEVEADETSVRSTDTNEMIAVGLDEAYLDDMEKNLSPGIAAAKSELHTGLGTDPLASLHRGRMLITINADATLGEAIRIMQDSNIGALLVVDIQQRPVGIFTESDVLAKVATLVTDLDAHTVDEFMTPNPDVLRADVPIAHALHLMAIHRYRHVPIVDDQGIALGIISFRDVVNYIETYFDR